MRSLHSLRAWRIGLAVALLCVVAGRRGSGSQSAPAAPQATCVFTNPGYSGKCTQATSVPKGSTPRQACEAVLACLNNVDCLKTYCQATTVRTGWKLESAK